MKIGTKSVLFGVHCFFLHPFFVAAAWRKLYGFPWDPRLWVAFFVHDIGYIGKPNMDGDEGEQHPYFGARIMGFLFGRRWYLFTLCHSRFLSKKMGVQYSRLCVADKLAIVLTPAWLYLPMAKATGEIKEYMKDAARNSNGELKISDCQKQWLTGVKDYVFRWVEEHKEMKEDTWTSSARKTVTKEGVWQ